MEIEQTVPEGSFKDAYLDKLPSSLFGLTIYDGVISDESLKRFTDLRKLDLDSVGCGITDAGLRPHTKLQSLSHGCDNITDETLERMTDLEMLVLNSQYITDNSLSKLTKLKDLAMLISCEHTITEECIAALPSLKNLSFVRGQFSVEKLYDLRPDISVRVERC